VSKSGWHPAENNRRQSELGNVEEIRHDELTTVDAYILGFPDPVTYPQKTQ
jgi:hypothetical protein